MADQKERQKQEIEEAARKRRDELEHPEREREPDTSEAFNPVEGVPPHGGGRAPGSGE
jgi:hypothetical protein